MTDETTDQPQGVPAPVDEDAAPAVTPTPPASPAPVDVESIVATRLREWEEKRITPLQTLLNEKNEEIKRLKTASMSEEQREQLEIEERERERQQFETERWLFQKSRENPQVAGVLEKFLSLDDPDEQFALLVQAMTPAAPTPTPTPEASDQVPDVDPNNPVPKAPLGQIPDGTQMTREMRHRLLKQYDYLDS